MAPIASDLERELNVLEAEMKRLEAEYNMFFAGRLPRPPAETRSRVEGMVKRIDRMHISNTGTRFRFSTIQSRFAKLVELWNRTQRVREEGRGGQASQALPPAHEKADRVAVEQGKVAFTAQVVKEPRGEDE